MYLYQSFPFLAGISSLIALCHTRALALPTHLSDETSPSSPYLQARASNETLGVYPPDAEYILPFPTTPGFKLTYENPSRSSPPQQPMPRPALTSLIEYAEDGLANQMARHGPNFYLQRNLVYRTVYMALTIRRGALPPTLADAKTLVGGILGAWDTAGFRETARVTGWRREGSVQEGRPWLPVAEMEVEFTQIGGNETVFL